MLKSILAVAIGGAAGAVLRYGVGALLKDKSGSFPLNTLLVNITGCLFMGFLIGYFEKSGTDNVGLQLLLVTGFCGGFTTFSAFAYENIKMLQSGQVLLTLGYVFLSLVAGLLSVAAGLYAMKYFFNS